MSAHILIIDDETLWLKNLEFILTCKDYRVTSAELGREGADLILNNPHAFDVVLLDLMIPDMNGLEVLEAIKPVLDERKLPVIMQSGTQEDKHLLAALELGALCCLRKPYSHQELYPLLEKILKGAAVAGEIFP